MEIINFGLQELIQARVNKKNQDRQLKFNQIEDKKQEGINIKEKAK